VLPENYYLSNFDALTEFVVDTYREILSADELLWSDTGLYVRLLSRQGATFRIGKLKYPEIGDLKKAATDLAAAGLACVESPTELAEVLSVVTRPELLKLPELVNVKGVSRMELDEVRDL